MKKLSEHVKLSGTETITVSDLRSAPGEVLAQTELGRTFVITKNGKPVAVLSSPPGVTLTMNVARDGKVSYA